MCFRGKENEHEDSRVCCRGRHHKMERFMEVCLLVLLYRGTCHGYGLAEQLSEFGFKPEDLNISTLYRTLRKMEGEGSVVSNWREGGQGPKKRVYAITAEGREELALWIEALRERKARIEKLIARYDEISELEG